MNIKRLGLILCLGVFSLTSALAVQPTAINDLSAQKGSSVGSVSLNWTAPGEGSQAVQEFLIRYRTSSAILTMSDWNSATLYPTAPTPNTPGLSQTHTLTQLTPGVSYYFAIISRGTDTSNLYSNLSNSPMSVAKESCGQNPYDGDGAASVSPSTIQVGVESDLTFIFTAGAQTIPVGGKFGFRIPNGWTPPTTSGSISTTPGFISFTPASNGATLSISVDDQNVFFTVTGSTPLTNAAPISVHYSNAYAGCNLQTQSTFLFASQQQSCGVLTPISSSPQVTVTPGQPNFIGFNYEEKPVQLNTIYPIDLSIRDSCNNLVANPSSTAVDVTVKGQRLSGTTIINDTEAELGLDNTLSSPFPPSGGTVSFSMGVSSRTFYYRLNSNTGNPFRRIHSEFNNGSFNISDDLGIAVISNGITNLSVDSSTPIAGQTTVTFTPDGDNSADVAFINFRMPTELPYQVDLSSDGFSTIVRTFYGNQTNARISWYGDKNTFSGANSGPEYVPAGTYTVRIKDLSETLTNQSLSITVSAGGITGLVLDSNSLPVNNAEIRFSQDNAYRFIRTDSNGRYTLYGLKPGTQQVRIEKPGFIAQEFSVTIPTNGLLTHTNVTLQNAATIKIHFTRPSASYLPETWGNLRANTSNWSSQAYATVHFPEGQTHSDAGDNWNSIPSSYSVLNLNPSVQYTVSLDIPGLGMNPIQRTVTTTQEEDIALTRRPNISGQVSVPTSGNPNGMWISVEACLDNNSDQSCDNQDPSQRAYGGTYLIQGVTDGIYLIPGVNNGIYLLTARAPGYVSRSINATVAGGADVTNADISTLDDGESITGTITVNGDTGDLDEDNDGFFEIPINCWSPSTYQGSFTEVSLATHPTQTTGSYTLSGLSAGTYQMFVNLQGFEVTPAGQISVTVAAGGATRNITLQEFTGSLTGTITLPGSASDFNNVEVELLPDNSNFGESRTETPNGSGVYSFDKLGTGFYTVRANYSTTGDVEEKSVTVSNGQAATKNLALTGNTYTVSGTIATDASSPFNSLNYLVNGTTPTAMFNLKTHSIQNVNANRIVLERIRDNDFFGGSSGGANGVPFDPKKVYFGEYDANGEYSIPNIPEGIYRIYNNGELDNNTNNGNEIAETSSVIFINSNTTKDFDLIDGYLVSGSLLIDSGIPETNREIEVFIQNLNHKILNSERVTLTGTSAIFELNHIPDGNYILGFREVDPPTKYVAREIPIQVDGADVTGKQITLLTPARITGSLRIATSGELISNQNYNQFLSEGFRIEARANPWVQGGFGQASYPLIDGNNKFNILAIEGTYDVILKTDGFIGEAAIAQGKKQFINKTISGISVVEGQTLDVGVIDLEEGVQIRGTVTDSSSNPLPNILVIAHIVGEHRDENNLEATTNQLGQFTIYGADPARLYNVIAAPRPDKSDSRFRNYEGSLYGELRKKNVTPGSAPLAFELELAQGIVTGTVVSPDSGPLFTPFEEIPEPGAMIIMNPVGNTPENNPLGDIEINTNPDGTFQVTGLTPGLYNLYALAEGYANGIVRNIQVGAGVVTVNVGDVDLLAGAKISGTITKPDSSSPNSVELSGLLAVRSGFEELLIAKLETDASGSITGYSISGFQSDRAYDIVSFSEDDEITVLETGLVVNEDSELNLVLSDSQAPRILTQAKKNLDDTITITFEFTKPLRDSEIDLDSDLEADDNELDERFILDTGNGSLDIDSENLSSDRKRFVTTYTPAAGETSFVVNVNVTFNAVDSSNENYTADQDITFHIGIGASASEVITNLNGGTVELEDGSEFSTQPGTFGDESDESVEVTLRAAADEGNFAGANPRVSKAMAVASTLGLQAYPHEMASALSKARASDISPFSSFYDIFLPAGVSHFFPEGSEASLCLNYDDSVSDTDAYSMNIYYFNEATSEYLLEQTNKTIDTENNLICASIAHASVFTILNSSVPILTGAGYTGELSILNFPNPFNLKQKTVTLQDPGSLTASQTIDGTMIKMSIPTTMSGSIEIQIFNVAGEKVRTIQSEAAGGAHYYTTWDGKNDHGEKVASGTYIGRFTIGGANERFFKMAVLK